MPELADKYDEFMTVVDQMRSQAVSGDVILCHPQTAAEFIAYCDENGYERPEITTHDASS